MEGSSTDLEDEIGVFTLEDTYDNLKDVKAELEHEIDVLITRTSNNIFGTLLESIRRDEINQRHRKYIWGLLNNLHLQEPRILPHPKTLDLQNTIVQDFLEIVNDTQKILTSIEADVKITQRNIA